MSLIGVSGHWGLRWGPLAAGAVLGAAVTGGLLAALAAALGPPEGWVVVVAVAVVVVPAVADLLGRQGLTFPARQTSSGTVRYAGQRLGQAFWGFDLALGVTTYRTSRLYWAALALLVLAGSPLFCLLGTLAYAASFLVAIGRERHFIVREDWMLRRRRQVAVLGLALAAVMVAVAGV